MKLRVRVQDREFDVEIGDVRERPVVAIVDGERFEVWPDEAPASPERRGAEREPRSLYTAGATTAAPAPPAGSSAEGRSEAVPLSPGTATEGRKEAGRPQQGEGRVAKAVRAPIPGVVISIAARPGLTVEVGDELCVLEAMKMRNPIRATRSGRIAAIHVVVGQHVKHHDLLLEFEA